MEMAQRSANDYSIVTKMRKYLFFFFVFISSSLQAQLDHQHSAFSKADTLRGTLSPLRSCFDVLTYDLDITIDIKQKFISGSNTIAFKAVEDMKRMQIDLFANMKIEKIELIGTKPLPLLHSREFNAVFIDLPSIVKKDELCVIRVSYSGNPIVAKNPPWDGGFSWAKDGKNEWVGVSCQGTGASLWWPCKDHQSDEPESMWIRVAVPKGYMNVSNGRLKKTSDAGNGFTKYEWFVSYPINNYDVTLNIAKYKHFSETFVYPGFKDTLDLDYYVLAENLEKAKKQFTQVKPMMNCYYKMFGEYPFVKDGYKLVETPYLGMEHQSAVAYGNKYQNGFLGMDLSGSGAEFDYIIIHESAHEWWGNSITTNDIADMWVHEGFTTYSEALYMECMYGYDAYLSYINGIKQNVANDIPVIGVYNMNSEGSGDMYPKGALMIHTIRSLIDNDEKFFSIIKDLQETFKHKTINSTDVERYISEKSGIDLRRVFDQYLRKTQIPVLEINARQTRDDLQVEYRWMPGKEKNDIFDMPVKISFEKGKLEMIFPTNDWQSMTIKNMKAEDLKVATHLFFIDVSMNKK